MRYGFLVYQNQHIFLKLEKSIKTIWTLINYSNLWLVALRVPLSVCWVYMRGFLQNCCSLPIPVTQWVVPVAIQGGPRVLPIYRQSSHSLGASLCWAYTKDSHKTTTCTIECTWELFIDLLLMPCILYRSLFASVCWVSVKGPDNTAYFIAWKLVGWDCFNGPFVVDSGMYRYILWLTAYVLQLAEFI